MKKDANPPGKPSFSLRTDVMMAFISDVIAVVDTRGIIRYKSPNVARWFGWKPDDLIGKTASENTHPDDLQRVDDAFFDLAKRPGDQAVIECRYRCQDGHYKWIEMTVVNLMKHPDVRGFLINYRDITQYRKAEEQIDLLRRAIDLHFDGAYWMDSANRFIYVNDKGCTILGYTREELLGSHLSMVNPKATASNLDRIWDRLRTEGFYTVETIHRRQDGSEFPVEISAIYVCIQGKEFYCGFARDITERKKSQEEQVRLTAILESTSDVVATATPEGRVTYLNAAAWQMSGWKADEPLNERTIPDFHPESSTRLIMEEGLPVAAATGRWVGETEVLHRNGRTTPVSQVIIAHRSAEGAVQYYSTIMRDISERKRYEKKIQDNLQKLAAAQEAAKIGFWDLDLTTMHLEWSEGVKAIFDLAPGSPTPTYDEFWSFVHKDDKLFVEQQVQIQLEPRNEPSITYEYRIQTRTGRVKCLEHIGRQIISPKGALLRIYGSVQDITERKETEEALRISEARFKAQYQSSPIPTFTWQKCRENFVLKSINDAAQTMTEGRAATFIGRTASLMYQDSPSILKNIERCYEERIILHQELKSQHFLPGRHIKTTYAFVPPDLVMVHLEDFTEQRKAEAEREKLQQQLLQSQKLEAIGRLAGGVAHDFNNMLAVIIGHTELALDHLDPASQPYADLQAIRKATEHSAGLVRQLLAFARKQTIAPKILNLNEALQNMFNILKRLIGEDIDLVVQSQEDLWPVCIDPGQLDQVLANLCINARDAISGTGKITIETCNMACDAAAYACHEQIPLGDYVLLAVSDTGCGMDAATISQIFEPFFTTKESGKGSGLGLSTVYGIVSQNRGAIEIQSQPGQGSSFFVYLPRSTGEAEQRQSSPAPPQMQNGHETILLVEDEASLLKMTEIMLHRLGYRVLSARGPEEALRLVEEQGDVIDVLLTDVIMPNMNGRDLANKISTIRPGLRCLFMSGYTADVIADKGVLDKGVHFIQKPFQKKDLSAKLRELLDAS